MSLWMWQTPSVVCASHPRYTSLLIHPLIISLSLSPSSLSLSIPFFVSSLLVTYGLKYMPLPLFYVELMCRVFAMVET